MKKEQNGRKSLRRLKPTVGCKASKGRRRRVLTPLFRKITEQQAVQFYCLQDSPTPNL